MSKACRGVRRIRNECYLLRTMRVKQRGNLGDPHFERKCNGPNGLSRDSLHIQSLESYRLDDLPAVEKEELIYVSSEVKEAFFTVGRQTFSF